MNMHWKHTTVKAVSTLALRAAVRLALPRLEWRRHGIGVLQAYLREGDDHEIRVHIWHPSIMRLGIMGNGDVHDHRFRMQSTVLEGAIIHTECHLTPDEEGAWDVREVVHARKDIGFRYPAPSARVNLQAWQGTISRGEAYEFERGAFHRTVPTDALTVTVITKLDQNSKMALVVSPHDKIPVHAFEPEEFDSRPFVELAMERLR